jgi:hypothetical protein
MLPKQSRLRKVWQIYARPYMRLLMQRYTGFHTVERWLQLNFNGIEETISQDGSASERRCGPIGDSYTSCCRGISEDVPACVVRRRPPYGRMIYLCGLYSKGGEGSFSTAQ